MTRKLVSLTQEDQEVLRDELGERGEDDLADQIGVSRVALLRSAAGLPVLRGTRALIVSALEEMAVEDDDADGDSEDESDEDADDEENEDEGA